MIPRSFRRLTSALCAALICLPWAVQADEHADRVLESLRHLEIAFSDQEAANIRAQFADAPLAQEEPDWFDRSTRLLPDMAALSRSATHPAARIRLGEMHRQLLAVLVGEKNTALNLVEKTDPTIKRVEPGVGMTERDVSWAAMLEAMRRKGPQDPRKMDISTEEFTALINEVLAIFDQSSASEKQFLARVDAWAFGILANWDALSEEELLIASSVITEKTVPPEDLLMKMTGSRNPLIWLAGMQIGLTKEEAAAYPDLHAYLAEGHMAGEVDALLAQMVGQSGTMMAAQMSTLQMQMQLNSDLLFDKPITAPGLMGLE